MTSCGHIISFPEQPAGSKPGRSKRRIAIMSALATGWLPWGIKWEDHLPLCGRKYILCCGHVFRRAEAQAFADAGLIRAGEPDKFGRPTIVITDRGVVWLQGAW